MLAKITVIGNLGRDPEMRYTPAGQAVTSFSVATNRRYTTADGQQREETDWFTVSAWGRLGEQVNQFLTKGKRVYVEGRFHSRTYTGQDGKERTSNDITAERVLFLDRREGDAQGGGEAAVGAGQTNPDDLPF